MADDLATDFERVRQERDPLRQGRLATELLGTYQARTTELARIRKAALIEAVQNRRMSYSEVAAAFGLSKGRIGQIRHGGPAIERAFFGMGPVTVAFPQRQLPERDRPVIAAEDALAVDRVSTLLGDLALDVVRFPIPVDGHWSPKGDVVAICGPLNSHVTADALEHDPVLTFGQESEFIWYLLDRRTGEKHYSPKDFGESDVETAYIGRLPTPTGGTMLVIAGIHAAGSVVAVDYLARNLDAVYAEVGDERFSMLVCGVLHGETVEDVEVVCPPRQHRQFES